MTLNRTTLFLLVIPLMIILTLTRGIGQSIFFALPDNFSVCHSDGFQILINNNTAEALENVELEVHLPCAVEYLPGTIQGGVVNNVSDLSNPSFILADIGIGNQVTIIMDLFAPCENVTCIDDGDLFLNSITLSSNQGTLNQVTQLYDLVTPLPVITRIEDPVINARKGQTVERKIYIKNTRPGYLDTLVLIDNYVDGLTMTSNLGQNISSIPGVMEILLTGNDFNKFGDGDLRFEFNEEIVLIETITIDACGFSISAIRSSLDLKWGCNNSYCPYPFEPQTALIDLEFKINEGPVLEFIPNVNHPACLCNEVPTPQSIIIRNIDDNHSAVSINFFVNTVQFQGSGFTNSMVEVISTNGNYFLEPQIFGTTPPSSCFPNSLEYRTEFSVVIPEIEPGEEIELIWDTYFCNSNACNDDLYQWEYLYDYIKDCTFPNDRIFSGSETVRSDLPYILETTLESGEAFEYLDIQTINYTLASPFFEQRTGTLDIVIEFPCHLEVLDNDWLFNNETPAEVNISESGGTTFVGLSYTLPLDFESGIIPMQVQFVCDDKCQEDLCKKSYISTCPGICGSETFLFSIRATAQLNYTECAGECPVESCAFRIYFFDCVLPFCEIFIPGYLNSDFDIYRLNTGLPDNDNDHFPDATGELDEDLIRLDHVITGDTVRMEVKGEIVIDIPGEYFTKGIIDLNTKQLRTEGMDFNKTQIEYNRLLNREAGFITVKKELVVKDASSGKTYICSDVPVFDPDSVGNRTYDLDIQKLVEAGSDIPIDFRYEDGDSIYFVADFFIKYNMVSLLLNYGSMEIEFLNINTMYEGALGGRDDLFACGCPTRIMKFANYKTAVTSSASNIDCCFGGAVAGDFKVLKYGTFTDFFPYEYKPPVELVNLQLPKIEGLDLISARIVSLKSNDLNIIVDMNDPSSYLDFDLSNIREDTTSFSLAENITGYYLLEVGPDLNLSWDENVEMRIEFEYRNLNCTFFGSRDYEGTQELIFAPEILLTNYKRDIDHGVELLGKQPRLNTNINLCDVTSFSEQLIWEIEIIASLFNNELLDSSIHNVWLYPENANGILTDFMLTDRISGDELNQTGGIFQLGSITDGDTLFLEFRARSSSCDREEITFNYGWDCAQYENIESTPCFQNQILCSGEAPPGLVDMIPETTVLNALLCDTMPWSEVYVFNAGLGPITDIIFTVQMPPGLSLASGTAQIEYEAGSSNYFNIPDPATDTNGNLFWRLDELIDTLSINGLSGVNSSPLNGLNIRFKTITECLFISGSRMTYSVDVQRACGEPGNTVSKFSSPLTIKNTDSPYTALISLDADLDSGCQDIIYLSINFSADQATGLFDDIIMQIPSGLSYVSGSCTGDLIDCEPEILNSVFTWHLPEGRENVNFSYQLSGIQTFDCGNILIPVNSTSEVNAICVADGSDCSLKVSTGELIFTIEIERPVFDIESIEVDVDESNLSMSDIYIQLRNTSSVDADSVTLSLYLDVDNSGDNSLGDTFIGDFFFNQLISAGENFTLILEDMNIDLGLYCQLIIVIDENTNCVCFPDILAFNNTIIIEADEFQTVCSGDTLILGIPEEANHEYLWASTVPVSCSDCSTTSFSVINTGFQPQEYFLTLVDLNSSGCEIQYSYQIIVNPQPGIWSDNNEICLGDELVLLASEGESYNWDGEGITNPELQAQTVSPQNSTVYIVTVTDGSSCSAIDSAEVIVYPLPVADAGPDILACYGQEVFLTAGVQDTLYTYFWTPGIPFLDDPLLAQPQVLLSQDQDYILSVTDDNCYSLDTVSVNFYDGLDIETPDTITICYGDPVAINLEPGIQYNWEPSFSEMCQDDDCSQVVFFPENPLVLTVIGSNVEFCSDTSLIVIQIIDPDAPVTDFLNICPGEEVELFGQLVSLEGIYCDTIMSIDGCDMVNCIELGYLDPPFLEITASDSIVEPGSEVQLTASSGFVNYEWVNSSSLSCLNCSDPQATVFENEVFTLTATDINGCVATDDIEIVVREICDVDDILIPNAFTANANNLNDRFRVANTVSKDIGISIEVYDRWGELLYEENGNTGWDGSFEDKEVPEGVYLYIIRVDCEEGDKRLFKGNVTLIR